MRDAFGRPVVPPSGLTREERIELLREIADTVDAGRAPSRYAMGYLAGVLREWLGRGGDLERLLGVRPPRGSRRRPESLARLNERDRLIVRFAARAGSDRAAVMVLRGEQPCPPELAADCEALRAKAAPRSVSGIWKARRRVSSHQG